MQHGSISSVPGPSLPAYWQKQLWLRSEGGLFRRHSVLQQALSSSSCSDTARTLEGRNGPPKLPRFHHCFPKHPWNVSSRKTPFHPESPALRSTRPRSLGPAEFHSLKENSVHTGWAYSCSARTRSHRVNSHKVLSANSRHSSALYLKPLFLLLEVSHANWSHCLGDDTKWGRITWNQTYANLFNNSFPAIICCNTTTHWVWARDGVLVLSQAFLITPPSTPTHWPRLRFKSKMLQTNNMTVFLCTLRSDPQHHTSKQLINHSTAKRKNVDVSQ